MSAEPYNPLYIWGSCFHQIRTPIIQGGASVQQGLSAAFKVARIGWHHAAADKRYSLGRTKLPHLYSSPMQSNTTSSPADFDFVIGSWSVAHRRLKERLANCSEWVEFPGTSETRKVLGGLGNIEDNLLELPEGTYRAVALRSFNPVESAWAIWWLDGRAPWSIDTPVIGKFSEGVGLFYADDVFNGKPIRVRFTWTKVAADALRWEQAFSTDAGATWETNWIMSFARRPQATLA